jgi:Ni,Fe-hydrogenase III large subunit
MARDLTAFVVPDQRLARVAGLDLRAAGLRPVATPRHATVLFIVGPIPNGLASALAVAYAQMPRPRLILAVGQSSIAGLPEPDVVSSLDQDAVARSVAGLRDALDDGAFTPTVDDFELSGVQTHTEYVCPMHPEVVRGEPGTCPICGMDLVAQEAASALAPDPHSGPDHAEGHEHGHAHPPGHEQAHGHGHDDQSSHHPVPRHEHTEHQEHEHSHDHAPMLAQAQVPAPSDSTDGGTSYTCPMHPEVAEPGPGRCPICGMTLVPREAAEASELAPRGDEATASVTYTCPMHPEIKQSEPGRCPVCGMHLVPAAEEDDDPASTASREAAHGNHEPAPADHAMHNETDALPCPTLPMVTQGDAHAGEHAVGHAGMTDHPTRPSGPDINADDRSMPAMDHSAMGHGAATHSKMDHGPLNHGADTQAGVDHAEGDHAGMDHSMHGGGFMSMIAVTRDLPRSDDGLPMEWVEVPFGPLFPGLPGGLNLTFTLDGDGVARTAVAAGVTARGLAATWPGPAATFPERLARVDPMAPIAYRLLAQRALAAVAGIEIDEDAAYAHVRDAEWERVGSHLGWLAQFGCLLGNRAISQRAAALQLAAKPGRVAPARLIGEIRSFVSDAQRAPFMSMRLASVGTLGTAEPDRLRGPVARAAGIAADARSDDIVYQRLGFTPVLRSGGDALARYRVRLAEIAASLDLLTAVGGGGVEPYQVKTVPADLSGLAVVWVETPRGASQLRLVAEGGSVVAADLDAPSSLHFRLIPHLTAGSEVADALVAVASLDLSPWEVDQ